MSDTVKLTCPKCGSGMDAWGCVKCAYVPPFYQGPPPNISGSIEKEPEMANQVQLRRELEKTVNDLDSALQQMREDAADATRHAGYTIGPWQMEYPNRPCFNDLIIARANALSALAGL